VRAIETRRAACRSHAVNTCELRRSSQVNVDGSALVFCKRRSSTVPVNNLCIQDEIPARSCRDLFFERPMRVQQHAKVAPQLHTLRSTCAVIQRRAPNRPDCKCTARVRAGTRAPYVLRGDACGCCLQVHTKCSTTAAWDRGRTTRSVLDAQRFHHSTTMRRSTKGTVTETVNTSVTIGVE
jgi:hypothetical protein